MQFVKKDLKKKKRQEFPTYSCWDFITF